MEKKKVLLPNGETYYYIDEGNNEEVILLVHGNMSSGVHYKPLIERFKGSYRVIAPDMRGFGDSTYNKRIESLEDLSDDLFLFLKELNITKVHIAGWSTGGAVALKLAAKHSEMIDKIILIESASYRGYPVFKKDENNQPIIGVSYDTIEELAKDPVQVLPIVNAFKKNDMATIKYIWDLLIYNVNKPSEEDDLLYLKETMKQVNIVDIDWCLTRFNMSHFTNGVTDGDGSIDNIKSPVLSLWSESDIVVLEYMIDETVKALKDVKKVILKSSGHSPLVDCPNELYELIINFI